MSNDNPTRYELQQKVTFKAGKHRDKAKELIKEVEGII